MTYAPVDSRAGAPGPHEHRLGRAETVVTLALKTPGFKKDVATRAIREALEHDAPTDMESLIKAALKRCGFTS